MCDRAARTSSCSIEDVSRHGATIVIDDGLDVIVGDTIIIDVERLGSTTVGFRVKGTVRHVSPHEQHQQQRIGLHITFDSPHEQRIAQLFAEHQTAQPHA